MPNQADFWLILLALTSSGLAAGLGAREIWRRNVGRRDPGDGASDRRLGPRSRRTLFSWLLFLGSWIAAALIAAVLDWGAHPGEGLALALAAMLAAVVGRLVIALLYITPIVLSQRGLPSGPAAGAVRLYRRWQVRGTMLDVISFVATAIALVLSVDASYLRPWTP